MIVVDTCIITHLFNQTELTSFAQEILDYDSEWCVPTTWMEEYANVLAKLFRKSKYNEEDVITLFKHTCEQLQDREYSVEAEEALIFAMRYKISVYDAYFVVLAERLNVWLVSEDHEVLKKCKDRAISIRDYLKKIV